MSWQGRVDSRALPPLEQMWRSASLVRCRIRLIFHISQCHVGQSGIREADRLYRTLNGATTLDEFDTGNVIPDQYVGRIAVDANDNNVVYIALAGYAGAGQNVWKSNAFLSATPTFSAAGSGIANVPVNALLIDPANSATVYAGTDIGVYRSTDSGANWAPLGSGLPRVPVFGLAFNGPNNSGGRGPLRAATHGRGIWEMDVPAGPGPNIFADGFEGPWRKHINRPICCRRSRGHWRRDRHSP